MAVAMKMQGKIPEAVQDAREALRLEPKNPDRHTLLAEMLLAQGSTEEAIQHYREALRINPRHPAAQRGLQRAMAEGD
jgi:DnaJ family protein C protein 7